MDEPESFPGFTDLVEIGRGGFGVVYRAYDTDLDRFVALKVFSSRLSRDELIRVTRERRTLGKLSHHRHIAPLYTTGESTWGNRFLVMQFFSAGSLATRLANDGPTPWRRAVEEIIQLASALDAAHASEILHRDIKPANVLLDEDGNARLADFGQARHTSDERTVGSSLVATPEYLAPEVAGGGPATKRADLFSLATTAMALILGRSPFAGRSGELSWAVAHRVATEPAPDLRPLGVPDAVCTVLERALSKTPDERQSSVREFAADLRHALPASNAPVTTLLGPSGISPPPAGTARRTRPVTSDQPARGRARLGRGRPNRRRILIAATTVLVVTLAAAAWIVLGRSSTSRSSRGVSTTAPLTAPADPARSNGSSIMSSPTAVSVSAGSCRTASANPVPCTVAHRFEVISTSGECTPAAAVRYLGGDPSIDVAYVALASLPGSDACLLAPGADGESSSTSVKGVFSTDDNGHWRRCHDDRTASVDVACDASHTEEYIGAPSGTVPSIDQCRTLALAYMQVGPDRLSNALEVKKAPTTNPNDGRPRCVIAVLGDNHLTGTLRALKTQLPPIEAN